MDHFKIMEEYTPSDFNILIVDDNHDSLTLLYKILDDQGYRVRPTLSGEQAIRSITSEVPDIVLLDIMMPDGMSGFETCQKIRTMPGGNDIPVIFISALDDLDSMVEAFSAGGQDYISKPIKEKEVLARVKVQLQLLANKRKLEYQEQQIRLITDNSPAFIIYIDSSDFTIKFVNKKFQEILGKPIDFFIGKPISEVFTDKTNKTALPHLHKVLKGESTSFEYNVQLEEGELWIKVDCVPDTNSYDNVRGIVALGYDITWEKKLEKLRLSMMADVSHELRTPLAVLQAKVEAIQDGIRPCDREQMDTIHGEIIDLSKLVDNLFELSLTDSSTITYNKSKVDVSQIVKRNVNLYSNLYENKQISLHTELTSQAYVLGDESRLNQVFKNLLNNSYYYTDNDGSVFVTLQEKENNIVLQIRDSAPGVSDPDLHNIFIRFFRIDKSRNRKHGGAGLGLSLCKTIIEEHEGSITADHSPEGGLALTVILPKIDTE